MASRAKSLSLPGQSWGQLLEREVEKVPIITLVEAMDEAMGGGAHRGSLTEIYGPPGAGKTQCALQLAANVHLPTELDGVGSGCLYIDTEGSFTAGRFAEISQGLIDAIGMLLNQRKDIAISRDTMLANTTVYRVHDHTEQLALVHALPTLLRKKFKQIGLIVIDSITYHFRDYVDYRRRKQVLAAMGQRLLSIAATFDIAVVCTNGMSTVFEDGVARLVPALESSWAHLSAVRIGLDRTVDDKRVAVVHRPADGHTSAPIPFDITPSGMREAAVQQACTSGVGTAYATTTTFAG